MYTRKKGKNTQNHEQTGRQCDHAGCMQEGLYRAPKDRTLKEHYWFCLKHVQEYNKKWNYYEGLSPDQIEQEIRLDLVGHRPTWKVNDLYANRLKDPLDILGLGRTHRRASSFKQAQEEKPSLATIEHLEAIKVLKLSPPITLEAVKRNYKTLAKKYHPDKNGGDKSAEEIFKSVTCAYRLLMKALK